MTKRRSKHTTVRYNHTQANTVLSHKRLKTKNIQPLNCYDDRGEDNGRRRRSPLATNYNEKPHQQQEKQNRKEIKSLFTNSVFNVQQDVKTSSSVQITK